MPKTSDVIIIGGGVVGLSCAYYLQQRGLQTTLLEKGEIGSGCSQATAGLLTPSHFVPLAAPGVLRLGLKWMLNPESPFYIKPRPSLELLQWLWLFGRSCTRGHVERSAPLLRDLSLASLALYRELAQDRNLDFGLQEKGLLMLYKSTRGKREAAELVESAHEIGLEAQLLDNAQINQLDPSTPSAAQAAAYFPGDCHLWPERFVEGLTSVNLASRIEIRRQTEVLRLELQGGKIHRILTTAGEFSADTVVLAGGAWSSAIARMLQLKLPLQAGKGYSVTLARAAQTPTIPSICDEARIAVTPLPGRLRMAGTMELSGLDRTINFRRVKAILKAVPDYYPELDCRQVEEASIWGGLRPCTPDGLPYLGRCRRIPNLIVAVGHAMVGLSLAPITGRLVADIVCDRRPGIDLTLLAPERFG